MSESQKEKQMAQSEARIGRVYLVGAGPGDPGLITVRGMELLKAADAVVHDHLAGDRLLRLVKENAEVIYVGKRGGVESVPQEDTTSLLKRLAREGKTIVRLKGGDPFIFGRGAEEARALAESGVPFEVVPGVSSATAAPACAGIPLTHRRFSSAVAIVAGHEDPDKPSSTLDYEALSRIGTLVFLMGMDRIESITARLIDAGRDQATPAAVVRWGGTPMQRTVTGTLAGIARKSREAGFKPPCVIVVGEVVGIRDTINWFERRPLFGRRILVTRPRHQAAELSSRIEELGGCAVEMPLIEVTRPVSFEALDKAVAKLSRYDWLVFTSANAVPFFMSRLRAAGADVRALSRLRIAVIGPGTASALDKLNVKPDVTASNYTAEGLAAALKEEGIGGQRFLIARAEIAREVLPEQLRQSGCEVDVVDAYRVAPAAEADRSTLTGMLEKGELDMVTFTSSSTVMSFLDLLAGSSAGEGTKRKTSEQVSGLAVACIGPVTAATAREAGLRVDVMPKEHSIPALVDAIVSYYKTEKIAA